ncbi:MAG TPA: hypothetical protein VMQ61_13325, partial [Thermoanaerobaculia bacterium]|nr:hypothetical protein [Thermoanaerobaculia bacterium]
DLAREISSLKEHLSEASSSGALGIVEPRPKGRRMTAPLVAAVLAVAAAAAAYFAGARIERARAPKPRFRQLTFRGAGIGTARFSPDGRTIVFSTQTEGRPPELFSMRVEGPEARSLGLPPAQILSISASDQMAILLAPPFALGPRIGHIAFEQTTTRDPFLLAGTLAVAALGGGAPRELLADVSFADWDAEGKNLAVVHRAGNRYRVEYPIGTTVFDREESILNHVRLSPRNLLALKDWDDLYLKETGGGARRIVTEGADIENAWFQPGRELWTSVGPGGGLEGETEIRGITSGGRVRIVAHLPGEFILYDIAPDGRVLLGRLTEMSEVLGSFHGEARERDLTLFNTAGAGTMSDSGNEIVIGDTNYGQLDYLERTDGSAPKRLRDDCPATNLSPDGGALLCVNGDSHQMSYAPVGPGPVRKLDRGETTCFVVDGGQANFFPDGRRVYFPAQDKSGKDRIWILGLESGDKPRAITPEGVRRPVVMGDGRFICARAADLQWYLYPVDEKGEPRKVVGILPGEEPIRSSPEGLLYLRGADELRPGETLMTTRIYRLDPITGRRELWKEIPPRDTRTGGAISTILFSADGKTCVWTHIRYSTELVLAEGLR